jgi:uncharacterized protein (DUF1810 family)
MYKEIERIMNVNFNLDRFIDAQTRVLPTVLQELKRGRKQTHWMWFVFPQIAGLGRSETARYYAIINIDEAKAYMLNLTLKARLEECISAVLSCNVNNPVRIFGEVDALKFHSSLTLFAMVEPENELLQVALNKYFGTTDFGTEQIIKKSSK